MISGFFYLRSRLNVFLSANLHYSLPLFCNGHGHATDIKVKPKRNVISD